MKESESKYIAELRKIVLDFFKNKRVKVLLFGSRAREEDHSSSYFL